MKLSHRHGLWALFFIACASLSLALSACNSNGTSTVNPAAATKAAPDEPAVDLFRDLTRTSGIDATYRNGQEAGHYAILESLGGGVALIDFDGDGWLDIFVPCGGYYDGPDKQQIKGHPSKLFKNLGGWKFKDVTEEVGLHQPLFYTHGAAVADYDNDGWPDLLVTGWGGVVLYHNEPDGKGGRRFVDVTKKAGLTEPFWATSAAWADFDGDGYADLYVCQYVNWSFANNPPCSGYTGNVTRDVCPPKQFDAVPHRLFRNNRDGTFTNVSDEAGIRSPKNDKDEEEKKKKNYGKGLGVVVVDVNGDGKPDIYVANDTVDNFLYLNKSSPGKLRFDEIGFPNGVARDDRGVPNGSMGTDAGDYDGSGRPALWVTNYENEFHALYRNLGNSMFIFASQLTGITALGQRYVGFGTVFFDYDNDGWEDLVVANGHVIRHPAGAGLRQRPVLLHNNGKARFADATRQGGTYYRDDHIGRGIALGDLDNDGWPDLVISHLNEPVTVLRNEAAAAIPGHHWLGFTLAGKNNRDVVGAKIVVEAGGRKRTRFAKGGGSYLSASDPRHLFGLGTLDKIERVTVTWPSGEEQTWPGVTFTANQYWRLVEGQKPAEAWRGPGAAAR